MQVLLEGSGYFPTALVEHQSGALKGAAMVVVGAVVDGAVKGIVVVTVVAAVGTVVIGAFVVVTLGAVQS